MAMRPAHSFSGASHTTLVPPQLLPAQGSDQTAMISHEHLPMTVMGEQPRPTGTLMPERSRPTRAATAVTVELSEFWTLAQHWGESGGVTGGGGEPVAAARLCPNI